jgi:hypothetical protein
MAAMDAILEYTCQCRHEEMLLVVSLLSSQRGRSTTTTVPRKVNVREPDDLEKFTMSKIKETAEYWRDVEVVTIRVQRWYRFCRGWVREEEAEEELRVEDEDDDK